MRRRTFLVGALAAPLLAEAAWAEGAVVRVAKSPQCGCCGAWVEHLRAAGFETEVRDMEQAALDALKAELGIAREHASCHTATVEGYVVEGHVPAEDIRRLLAERPDARGVAVPGMPLGSPGMEMGDLRDSYDTLLIGKDGGASVFAGH
jgi:hypothetical protein